ncbi:MAG: hypothetical protein ACKO66_08105 [Flavobacteriales bacterium]
MKKLFFFSICVAAFMACGKRRESMISNQLTIDNSTAENLFNDLFKVSDDISSNTSGIREDEIGCIDTIIVDTASTPRSVLIDFGDDACTGLDGRVRTGQVFITYTGRYRDTGTIITITPQNYRVNGYLLSGTKTVTNLGLNAQGQLHYSVVVNGTITAPNNAWTASWSGNRTRTWLEGAETLTRWDDVYTITGSGSGVNRNGIHYSLSITNPLRVEVGCRWIVSGSMTIYPDDHPERLIDFGNGECNNGFTVTVDGETNSYGSED